MTRKALETRRMKAGRAILRGMRTKDVMATFRVGLRTACRWRRKLNETGTLDALRERKAPGRPRTLSPVQEERLVAAYRAQKNQNMTSADFARFIKKKFRKKYDTDHARRIMHRLGIPVRKRGVRRPAKP